MAQVFATETSRTFLGWLDLFVAEVSGRDFILSVVFEDVVNMADIAGEDVAERITFEDNDGILISYMVVTVNV